MDKEVEPISIFGLSANKNKIMRSHVATWQQEARDLLFRDSGQEVRRKRGSGTVPICTLLVFVL